MKQPEALTQQRLHEVNQELLEAIRPLVSHGCISTRTMCMVEAAYAKATGGQS